MLLIRRSKIAAAAALAFLSLGTAPLRADPIETTAKQAIIIDVNTGAVLLDKNADQRMPPSSMSKLMTAYLTFERLKDGSLRLTDSLPVSQKAWSTQGSKTFVDVGSQVKVEDMIRGMIIQSGNDACIVLAEGIANSEDQFAQLANKKAKQLGLTGSHFANATGLPDPDHYSTARDLSILATHLIQDFPEDFHYYSELNFTFHGITQGNRNPLLYRGIGADGMKTGHTDAGGYGLIGTIKRGDRRLLLVANGMSSMKERSEESERLLEWAFREYDSYPLFKAGEKVVDAGVWLGTANVVPLLAKDNLGVTLSRRARRDMKVTAVYNEPLPAPIKAGDVVGKVLVTAPGLQTLETPLIAGADVPKLGFMSRIGVALNQKLFGAKTN